MSALAWAPLQHLSLVRLHNGRVPRVPTNAERMAAYRPYQSPQFANAVFLTFPARSPAITAHSPCVPAAGFSVSDDEE